MKPTILFLNRSKPEVYLSSNKQSLLFDSNKYGIIMINHIAVEPLPEKITNPFLSQIFIDLNNHNEVIKEVKRLNKIYSIAAVISLTEREQTLAGKVRTLCKIDGISYKQSFYLRDKVMMKQKLKHYNLLLPQFMALQKDRLSEAFVFLKKHNKVVFKPRSGTGSMDTVIVRNEGHLKELLDNYYENIDSFYLEEFISGEMYCVDSTISEGRVIFSGVMKYQSSTLNFKKNRNVFSCIIPEDTEIVNAIKNYTKKIISIFNINKGATHLEVFVNHLNQIIFCEIASRPGGGYIAQALENSYGISVYESAIKAELNEPILLIENRKRYSGFLIFNHAQGKVKKITLPENKNYSWILLHEVNAKEGDITNTSQFITENIATFLIDSPSYKKLIERIEIIEKKFSVSYY
ncbi:ATP-grasp domain-containing protein [Bacillus sp. 166amftsu]|uniref:ATP-grasp domain-containing protein n=1 Tax=Bacillus sp. 166amftsu TaxID=1761753 RepID=UPI00089A72AA|nr:ATP-grasp domain-containing protein [Bacillus sp. 166amftsu]SDZ37945.1 ATP-grasp domain-containing protein [Bacillus sp. 166amftsu]